MLVGVIAEDLEKMLVFECERIGVVVNDIAVNPNHVHMFIQYSPKLSASDIARRLKGATSKKLREKYPELVKWCPDGLWAPSCFHGSVGHGTDVVSAYIRNQEKHHGADKGDGK